MLLSNQFPELFRDENYRVQLALYRGGELDNPFSTVLRTRGIDGIWDMQYSLIPVGELSGRQEAEPIPLANMTMGWPAYGAICIEAAVKLSLSKHMKEYSRGFTSGDNFPEANFAGHIADSFGMGVLSREAHKRHKYAARIFNYGAIPAGDPFFDQRDRAEGLGDVPAGQVPYDGVPLFAFANNPHSAFSDGATAGPTGAANGTWCGWALTAGAAFADTGGYFNAFTFPPSVWALKRVYTHFCTNMAFDENNIEYQQRPNTLLISAHNEADWAEIMNSKFIAKTVVNTENIFQLDDFKFRIVSSRHLVRNTWYLGIAKSPGVELLKPKVEEEPWAFWREEDNRSYFCSYERMWGFMIRNWRYWVGGSVCIDAVGTPPVYGNKANWETDPG